MKILFTITLLISSLFIISCGSSKKSTNQKKQVKMELTNKEKAVALLKSLQSGDSAPVAYINPEKYIQHNLAVGDGLAGFGAVLKNQPKEGFKVNVVRSFEDGDFVFTHTEYDFFGPKVGFDVFRFENGLIVEHWDNLTEITVANPSGRTQFDGSTTVSDKDQTNANKSIVKRFVTDILMNGRVDKITEYISTESYLQHNSNIADGLDGLGAALKYFAENNLVMEYEKTHKILGEGNFVLSICEGKFGSGDHVSFYDLFRLENGKIVEHWDIIEPIMPEADRKNTNGKFNF
ncbi:nuclear transport factor 2 family protein [Saprospiraceae bacterium]|nr:nuclear transport factor 2 family protein [Saprospiraceae bacterium]